MNPRQWVPWLWAAVVAVVVIHNGYLWWQQRLVPDTNILALLPAMGRDPVVQRALPQMVEAAEQRVIVLIGAADWDDARRAAAVYRQTIAPFPHLLSAAEAITERTETDWLRTFKNHRLTLLTSEDDAALRSQAQSYWIDRALAKLYSPFAGPQPLAWQEDPFGLFNNWLLARAQETPVRPRGGELSVSTGERHYVVLPLTLRVPAFALAGQQAVMPVLEQARQAVWQTNKRIEIVQAGVILHAAAAANQAQREMFIIGTGSMAGILFLIWMTFHSLKPIILVTFSMAIGCLGALSICSWLLFERIHLITLVFGASLIGVAQDYGIYFFCQRASAANDSLDSWRLLRRILPALILTMVTTLIGYLGLVLTPFPGLRQMALFSCTGLIFAWLTVVCWFPALARPATLGLHRWAQRYGRTMTAWPRLASDRRTLYVTLTFAGLLLFGGLRLSVQDDIRALQKPPQNLLDDQVKLGKILDLATPVQFYLLRAASAEALLQREETLKQRLDLLVQQNQITGYQAISNWLPSAHLQASRRQLIERSLLNEQGALARMAAKLGEAPSWWSAARERLLAAALPITVDDFFKSPASQPWRHLWLGQVGDQHASIVALRGVTRSSLPALGQAAARLEGVVWIDQVSQISALLGAYRYYMGWVLLVSYVAVYALLYPRYRRASWRVLAPTAVATLLTLALLGIAGQGLQLFHLLALLLLLGIGVDYGIILQEPDSQEDGTAWLAVGISALNTLLSFGLLGLSQTPALRAFGLTMAIGIGTVALIVPCFRQANGAAHATRR
ncbi:MAG: MMPL family transporter [Candidatus Binatia bacterium]